MSVQENGARSSKEIRAAIEETKVRIEHDLGELAERVEENLSPRGLIRRYPALLAVAGGVIGFLVVRRPAFLVSAASRLAQAGLPLIVSNVIPGLLHRVLPSGSSASPETSSEEPPPK